MTAAVIEQERVTEILDNPPSADETVRQAINPSDHFGIGTNGKEGGENETDGTVAGQEEDTNGGVAPPEGNAPAEEAQEGGEGQDNQSEEASSEESGGGEEETAGDSEDSQEGASETETQEPSVPSTLTPEEAKDALGEDSVYLKAKADIRAVLNEMDVSKREYYRRMGRIFNQAKEELKNQGKVYAEYLLEKLSKELKINRSDLGVAAQFALLDPKEKSVLSAAADNLSWRRIRRIVTRIKTAKKFRDFIKKNPDIDRWGDDVFNKALKKLPSSGSQGKSKGGQSTPPSQDTVTKQKQKAKKARQGSESTTVVDEASKVQLDEVVAAIQAQFSDIAEIVSGCDITAENQGASLLLKLTADQCTALHEFVCGDGDGSDQDEDDQVSGDDPDQDEDDQKGGDDQNQGRGES